MNTTYPLQIMCIEYHNIISPQNSDLFQCAIEVITKIKNNGYVAYIVGGFVRDSIAGCTPNDIDISSDASDIEIRNIFKEYHINNNTQNFGLSILRYKNHKFDIMQLQSNDNSNRSIESDVMRRDFTINSLYYDPIESKIFDYVRGLDDIKNNILRCVGDPAHHFMGDKFRILRFVRFVANYNYEFNESTGDALKNLTIKQISMSPTRIWKELNKITNFSRAIRIMSHCNLLKIIFPSTKKYSTFTIELIAKIIESCPEDTPFILKIAILMPKETSQEYLKRSQLLKRMSEKDKNICSLFYKVLKLIDTDYKYVNWRPLYQSDDFDIVIRVAA